MTANAPRAHRLITLLGCALSACFPAFSAGLTAQHVAAQLTRADEHKQALPLAHRVDETLTIERAYEVQMYFVRAKLQSAAPAGFKAGLTTHTAQQRFDTDAPVAGVLIEPAQRATSVLHLRELPGLHLETEVAFRIGKRIDTSLTSVEDLRAHVDGIAPAVELPNLHYVDPSALNAVDIVAGNVGAAHYILGEFKSVEQRDPNQLEAQLVCNGEEVSRGSAREAMGDQWDAALWLVNTVVKQGWTLAPGQVLLTGALGKMVKAQPGHCSAQFGEWGTIAVEVAP